MHLFRHPSTSYKLRDTQKKNSAQTIQRRLDSILMADSVTPIWKTWQKVYRTIQTKKAEVVVYPNDKIYALPRSIADKWKFCLAELS
jgi:hypothetical protein